MTEETLDGAVEAVADTNTVAETSEAPSQVAPSDPDAELSALYDKLNSPDDAEPEPEPVISEEADQPKDKASEPSGAIAAPSSWSAEVREKWASLPPDVQSYIAQRETEAHKRISQMGQELSQYKPLGELRTRTQDVFDRNGLTFEQGLERLVYAQQVLEANPMQGLAAIAQSYGIDLTKAFGGQQAQQGQADPRIARLEQELNQYKAVLTNQQRESMASRMREQREQEAWAAKTVEEWANGKEYLDAVREDMQRLLSSGVATDLDDAYNTAILRNPEIRSQVEAAQRAQSEAKERAERERALKDAKRAAKLNTGDKPAVPKPKGRWDDDGWLSQAYDAVAGG